MKERTLVAVGYEDICTAADAVPAIAALEAHRPRGARPGAVRGRAAQEHASRGALAAAPRRATPGCSSSSAPTPARSRAAEPTSSVAGSWAKGTPSTASPSSTTASRRWRSGRYARAASAQPRSRRSGGDQWPGWEDSAVPPAAVGAYLRDLKELYRKHGLHGAIYGHLGQGCIHSRINFDLRSAQGIAALPGLPRGRGRSRRLLRRLALRRARRRPAARPSCSSGSTGPSWSRRCASSSASGIPTGR